MEKLSTQTETAHQTSHDRALLQSTVEALLGKVQTSILPSQDIAYKFSSVVYDPKQKDQAVRLAQQFLVILRAQIEATGREAAANGTSQTQESFPCSLTPDQSFIIDIFRLYYSNFLQAFTDNPRWQHENNQQPLTEMQLALTRQERVLIEEVRSMFHALKPDGMMYCI